MRRLLEAKNRDELNVVASALNVASYRKLSKAELIDALLASNRKALQRHVSPSWWDRYHNHVYGVSSLLALAIAMIPLVRFSGRGPSPETAAVGAHQTSNESKAQIALRKKISRIAEEYLEEPPVALSEWPEAPGKKELNDVTNEGFVELTKNHVWDARGWTVASPDVSGAAGSYLTLHWATRARRETDAVYFSMTPKTSGNELITTIVPQHPCDAFAITAPRMVGATRMLEREIRCDLSSVPIGQEFALSGTNTMWNSLQSSDDLWVGFIAREGLDDASDLVLFGDSRSWGGEYWATVAHEGTEIRIEPDSYEGDNFYFLADDVNHAWIYWQVIDPKPGYVYQLRWNWHPTD